MIQSRPRPGYRSAMAMLPTLPLWLAFAATLPLLCAALRLALRRIPAETIPVIHARDRARPIPCSGRPNSLFRTADFPVPAEQGNRRQHAEITP